MPLLKARSLGGTSVHAQLPPTEEFLDVVYVPNTADVGQNWGIFSSDGDLIPAGAFRRGPDRELAMQRARSNLNLNAVTATAPDVTYVYGGAIHSHFGHFLLSTLSRFWLLAGQMRTDWLFLMNAGEDAAKWLAHPHIGATFKALGLGPANFIHFDEPTRIPRLLVPHPAIEEQNFAHAVYAELTHQIGSALAPAEVNRSSTPVYLSKERLTQGVWRFTNEDRVTEFLAARGVEIAYPEQLPLEDQIKLFRSHETVCGGVGSALHAHVFTNSPPRIFAYNRDPLILSNFHLLDAVNRANAEYFYPEEGFTALEPTAEFTLNCKLNDPVRLAEDLLRLMERRPKSHAPQAAVRESLDVIGSRHGTDKSSRHHGFLNFYERFIGGLREVPNLKVLEIGVSSGASLRTWREYFPQAAIVGADNNPAAIEHGNARCTVEIADGGNIADLIHLAMKHGPFDLVVDDGSHFWNDQITALRTLYPFLNPGGFYIVEDIDTSYGNYVDTYRGKARLSAARYLQLFSDQIVGDTALNLADEDDAFIRAYARLTEFIVFHRRTALIRRRPA